MHPGGANFVFCDGPTQFVREDIDCKLNPSDPDDPGAYQARSTVQGGEVIDALNKVDEYVDLNLVGHLEHGPAWLFHTIAYMAVAVDLPDTSAGGVQCCQPSSPVAIRVNANQVGLVENLA